MGNDEGQSLTAALEIRWSLAYQGETSNERFMLIYVWIIMTSHDLQWTDKIPCFLGINGYFSYRSGSQIVK